VFSSVSASRVLVTKVALCIPPTRPRVRFVAWWWGLEGRRGPSQSSDLKTVTEIVEFDGPHLLPAIDGWEEVDEIFTRGVGLEDAALKRTDLDALPSCGTDRNGLYADVIMSF
jgi:hypothetical protein